MMIGGIKTAGFRIRGEKGDRDGIRGNLYVPADDEAQSMTRK